MMSEQVKVKNCGHGVYVVPVPGSDKDGVCSRCGARFRAVQGWRKA